LRLRFLNDGLEKEDWINYQGMNAKFIFLSLLVGFLFSACVNDLETIEKVTFNPKSPDDVTKNLHIFFTDSGYAKVELSAALAETFSKPNSLTKFKDGLTVNFYNKKGIVASTLTALYGEINYTDGTMLVRDSVQMYNHAKKQRMLTENLYWNQRDSSIYTRSNVVVKSPQGVLYGEGIKTKQDFSSYVFLKPYGKINFDKN
jgi:LPS export ABC transporter protein LptC